MAGQLPTLLQLGLAFLRPKPILPAAAFSVQEGASPVSGSMKLHLSSTPLAAQHVTVSGHIWHTHDQDLL